TAKVSGHNIDDDCCARRLGPRVDCVGVLNQQIHALRLSTADLVRLFHQSAQFRVRDGAMHDHSFGKRELGGSDGPITAGHHKLLFEAKNLAKPIDSRWGVAIAKAWNDSRSPLIHP